MNRDAMPTEIMNQDHSALAFQSSRKAENRCTKEAFQVRIAISADHQKMHDDSDVIQASTPGNIRLPRLWAGQQRHEAADT